MILLYLNALLLVNTKFDLIERQALRLKLYITVLKNIQNNDFVNLFFF